MKLIPCPFCNGEAETFLGWSNPEAQYGVRCKKCFSCTNPDNWEIWNHRPLEDRLKAHAVEVLAKRIGYTFLLKEHNKAISFEDFLEKYWNNPRYMLGQKHINEARALLGWDNDNDDKEK